MRVREGARVAVVGAGPGGLVAAKHLLDAGFDVTVLDAADDIGGQWYTTAAHSGVWPGMRTNTSRAMTAFSDLPYDDAVALHPTAEEIRAYLRRYAERFGLLERIKLHTRVGRVAPAGAGWLVDGAPYAAVVVASGRFSAPVIPPVLAGFTGRLLHAFDYPGAEALGTGRTLVYGNGISGHEIASDLAAVVPVISAYRKPRYVLQKNVAGVSSDWQWYTHLGAVQRRVTAPAEFGRMLREKVVRLAGDPADFGAPPPDPDLLVAGISLCQDYLTQVRDGLIDCRPGIASVDGRTVTFTDGRSEEVDTIVAATGYALHLPCLADEVWQVTGPDLRLHLHTVHPDLPTLGFVGQFAAQGPYFSLLELQARWLAHLWSGAVAPDEAAMRASVAGLPAPLVPHNALALSLSEAAGVAPDLERRPDLVEDLLFGPMLPARYRLDGPGARGDAEVELRRQMAASPRPPIDPADRDALALVGLAHLLAV